MLQAENQRLRQQLTLQNNQQRHRWNNLLRLIMWLNTQDPEFFLETDGFWTELTQIAPHLVTIRNRHLQLSGSSEVFLFIEHIIRRQNSFLTDCQDIMSVSEMNQLTDWANRHFLQEEPPQTQDPVDLFLN